jgi:hypothetical protein
MLALARLHLLVNDLDACQQQCSQLLEMDKDNDSAFMVNYSIISVHISAMFPHLQSAVLTTY